MQYIRIKISDGDITSSQILSKDEFEKWLSLHGPDMWSKCRDGLSVSFSKVKKSPLLITNKN